MSVFKSLGDDVVWSTLVIDSILEVEATAIWKDTYLQKIIALVDHAQKTKPRIQQLADRIMHYFVPTVLCIALFSALFWLFLGNYFYPDIDVIRFALFSFVWVLVIACPCGLWLATPMAVITGIWHGAKRGILAKNAEWLLQLRKADIVVFDKTGTITEGKPALIDIHQVRKELNHMAIIASLESQSSHPIATAITSYAHEHNISFFPVHAFSTLPGIGVQWDIDGITYTVAHPSFVQESWYEYDADIITHRTASGKTPLVLFDDQWIIAYYAVADTIKTSSYKAIRDLQTRWILPVMLTGDNILTAQYIASKLGIHDVYAEVTPDQKAALITELKKEGKRVVMVGDGINDAPALATADVWVAMSTWTDVAMESAEITLLHGDLDRLVKALSISKLTHIAIVQNLTRAFLFNIIGIPLAAWLFYPFFGVLLHPVFEWAAMALSSLLVLLNTVRLQAKKVV